MRFTYLNSDNSGTTATALDAQAGADEDRVVKKLIIGVPTSAKSVWLYTENNALGGATTNIAFKLTLPTFSSTNVNPGVYVVDFTDAGGRAKGTNGLVLSGGGSIVTDAAMQVTVLWDNPDDD